MADAENLMSGLIDANKALYSDDLETIKEYYRGSWFFDYNPEVPLMYRPPHRDVLVAYIEGAAAGAVAICRWTRSLRKTPEEPAVAKLVR